MPKRKPVKNPSEKSSSSCSSLSVLREDSPSPPSSPPSSNSAPTAQLSRSRSPRTPRRQAAAVGPRSPRVESLSPRRSGSSVPLGSPHISRRDTPTRNERLRDGRRRQYGCRNPGCNATFPQARQRNQHQDSECAQRSHQHTNISAQGRFPVPSHSQLGLQETECRDCGRNLSRSHGRRQHEIERHRYSVVDGQTYSPFPYQRPGPGSSASTTQTMSSQSDDRQNSLPPSFATPGIVSIGDIRSTRRSSSQPVPQTSPASQSNPLKCKFCLMIFARPSNVRDHRCPFMCNDDTNVGDYTVLKKPENCQEIASILNQLTLGDQVRMCRLNSWAIPLLWPLVFPGSSVARYTPILLEMTAARRSVSTLHHLLRNNNNIKLPKKVILVDDSQNIKSVLSTVLLTPPVTFLSTVSSDHIMVTSGKCYLLNSKS